MPGISSDVFSIALSGIDAAETRLRNSANNVANVLSEDYRNRRTRQTTEPGGGTRATTLVDRDPAPVDLADEFVEQTLGSFSYKANLRILQTALDTRGSLLDILA